MANGTDEQQGDATADGNILGWDRTTREGVVRFFKILLEWDARQHTIETPYEDIAADSTDHERTSGRGGVCASVLEGPRA